jgi:glycosyltransferase involved in cell wall biosynthesis
MRILVANSQSSLVGGIETYLRDLLPALLDRGHAVALLHEQGRASDAVCPSWCAGGKERLDALRHVQDWRPDVAYVQGLADMELEEWLVQHFPAARFAHGYVGTCVSGTKRHAFPWSSPCGRTLGAACLALYHVRRCGGLDPRTMLESYRSQHRRRELLGRYRVLLVASRHMREEYLRHGIASARARVLPLFAPGVVPDALPPARRAPTGRVLFVGRLTDLKGGEYLIRAAAIVNRRLGQTLQLTIAGDGPERATLEQLAQRLDVPAEFCGWVNQGRRTELMRDADVLAVPSVWPEPFGLVGLEAACVGLPAVAYAVGGIPDWLQPGVSGELAAGDPPTPSGLADAIVRALRDRDHHARLSHGAWTVSRSFTRERHVESLEAVLAQVCSSPVASVTAPQS